MGALADEILVMRDGVVSSATPRRICEKPKDPYTRAPMVAAFDLAAAE